MKRKLTCIVCPVGCKLEVTFKTDGKEIESITGNTCIRGEKYAREECIHPSRMLTTTIMSEDGSVIPVRTSKPIPKEMLFQCMEIINNSKIVLPISIGDVIINNIMNTGADIIATANRGRDRK